MAMTPRTIKRGLDEIASRDRDMARALTQVGYPAPRKRPPGFATLVGIIAGQQVSSAAAAATRDRLMMTVDPMTPERFLATDIDALRAAGLSGRKIEYGKGLAEGGVAKLRDHNVRRRANQCNHDTEYRSESQRH